MHERSNLLIINFLDLFNTEDLFKWLFCILIFVLYMVYVFSHELFYRNESYILPILQILHKYNTK